jgi:hypothetical protein
MTTKKKQGWFEVDRDGLRDLVAGRDYGFIANELLQNAFDEDVSHVRVSVSEIERGRIFVSVSDNSPTGFSRLDHAWTLFAPSKKKTDATKRGRFNLGEKYVLAVARSAVIETTTGRVSFSESGRRAFSPEKKTASGSIVFVEIPVTPKQREEIVSSIRRILVPENVTLVFDDGRKGTEIIPSRIPFARAKTTLPTVIAREDGILRSSRRSTEILIFETVAGAEGWIYELGIPVAKTGDLYDYDVRQKIPLGTDRETVSPAFLREVRAAVLDATRARLTHDDAISDWVSDALQSKNVSTLAVNAAMKARFGEKRVAFDPSDREANNIAASKGYTVVHGGSLPAETWENVRRAGDLPPAGKVTPSPRPYSPDGTPLVDLPPERISAGMRAVEVVAKNIANFVLDRKISVRFVSETTWPFSATYGPTGTLVFNVGRLGRAFFDRPDAVEILDLLVHEFGHEYASNHLSSEYHDALTKIAGRLALAVRTSPEIIDPII